MPNLNRPAQQPKSVTDGPSKPRKKRYLVTGPQRVGEVSRGGYVELALTEGQERVLLEAGCVERAPIAESFSEPATEQAAHSKWSTVKKNRPPKAETE